MAYGHSHSVTRAGTSSASSPVVLGALRLGLTSNVDRQQKTDRSEPTTYLTRHSIAVEDPTSKTLCLRVAADRCVPCLTCSTSNYDDDKPVAWIWYFVSSELLLFSLRITGIVIGVLKEVLDVRHDETIEHMHFVVSLVETAITTSVILILLLSARIGYVKVRQAVERLPQSDRRLRDAHLAAIGVWMRALMVIGVVYIVACVGCFVLFHHMAHLGWTLLSNQTCLITLSVLVGLYAGRVAATVAKIKDDQHKVIIHEALMLLQETCKPAAETGNDVSSDENEQKHIAGSNNDAVRRFIDAVGNTKSLAKPANIVVSGAV